MYSHHITLVEAGMSDTLLGNQSWVGYGSDNEGLSLLSAAVYLLCIASKRGTTFPRGEVPKNLSSSDSVRSLS